MLFNFGDRMGAAVFIIIIIIYSLNVFFYISISWWSLSDCMSPQVFMILLVDLHNAVVLIFSTRSLISKWSSSFTIPSVTVQRAPITVGIKVTFTFHIFFSIP